MCEGSVHSDCVGSDCIGSALIVLALTTLALIVLTLVVPLLSSCLCSQDCIDVAMAKVTPELLPRSVTDLHAMLTSATK